MYRDIRLLTARSSLTLNVLRHRASTTSLAAFIINNFFYISNQNIFTFSLDLFPLVLSQQTLEDRKLLHVFHVSHFPFWGCPWMDQSHWLGNWEIRVTTGSQGETIPCMSPMSRSRGALWRDKFLLVFCINSGVSAAEPLLSDHLEHHLQY